MLVNKYLMHSSIQVISNQEQIENNDLIKYLANRDHKLNFVYANVFDFYQEHPAKIAKNYYDLYQANVFHVKRKFLCDSLLYENIRTPFCFTKIQNNFIMTKGTNKLIAYAVDGLTLAPILIISQESIGYTITDMNELHKILKMFDPNSKKFTIKLHDNLSFPAIHYIENNKTIDNWFVDDVNHKYRATLTELPINSTIVLFGNLKAVNTLENVIYDNKSITSFNDLITMSNNYPNEVNYFLYSDKFFLIDEKYLGYIQYNFFLNQKIKFGFDKQSSNFFVFNRYNQDGVIGYVPLPVQG